MNVEQRNRMLETEWPFHLCLLHGCCRVKAKWAGRKAVAIYLVIVVRQIQNQHQDFMCVIVFGNSYRKT